MAARVKQTVMKRTVMKRTVMKSKTVVARNSKLGQAIKAAASKVPAPSKIKTLKTSKAVASKIVKPSAKLAGFKAVVINLKTREDRWQGLLRTATKNAPWLNVERLDAVDGRVSSIPAKDVCKKYSSERLAQLFHWYRSKVIDMSGGERGCCASHLKAWRVCASSNKPLIVLEDDAVILPSFTSTLNKALDEAPNDVGALWLTSKDRGSRKRVGEALMQPTYLWTTVGYIIWPAAAKAFIKLLPMDLPVDNFMAWHIKEHAVKGFSVQPACVRQANTWNIGSDVPHSDDVALWNHPSNN